MKWYKGKPIFKILETINIKDSEIKAKLRLPIQWVNRTNSDFRGFSGTIVSGAVKKGDKVIAYKDEAPIDSILGVDIFPVVHLKTKEEIYVGLEDLNQ